MIFPMQWKGNMEVAFMTDRIEKNIELRAPVERVWRALTDAAEFGQWFGVNLEGAFVPGQAIRGKITYPGLEHVILEARVVKMVPQRLFSFTWNPYAMDPAVDYSKEPSTLVEFRLEPAGEGTRLEVVESGFDALPEHRRAEAFRMNDGGWAQQMENIKAHVER
jgi:uncharacterized protein YndB with AHSA1/START domain